ncbi:uncharacterized protein NPIL_471651 [Nephila pilipes]|uniref:Ionotropic glutamate receptor L-glutamate and glycine-binding domain-containing protein n=1 Tax=Nephila pilipes TaxID=299642 RepID=A0A8X6TQL1_NEPPI|nr:uncharacterized protein NPIL_471651 [Nephila pilipes]
MDCPKLIRVTTFDSKEMKVHKNGNGEYTFSGLEGRYLDTLLKALNLQFEVILPKEKEWGRQLDDGNWTGMIGKIQKGSADLALNYLSMNEQRAKVVDFSTVYTSEEITFVIEKPGTYPVSMAFLYPFDTVIWITICIILLLMPLFLLYLFRTKDTYSRVFMLLLGSLLGNASCTNHDTFKYRVMALSWSIFGMILTFSYSAVLLSVLTVPFEIPVVKHFKELSEAVLKRNYKCYVPKGSVTLDVLVNNEKDHLRLLGLAAVNNNWYLNMDDSSKKQQMTKRSALLTPRSLLKLVAGLEKWKRDYLSSDSLVSLKFVAAMKKDFCYKRKINSLISRFNSAGVYMKILKEESFKFLMNNSKFREMTLEAKPLKASDFIGLFMLTLIGLTLGICAFLSEMAYYYWVKNK